MSISVVINTRNEESNIERCLKSVSWADEIIVVDMESQDRTVEKAKKYTPHIHSFEQTGYVEPARNFAISKATKDWILIVDADEEITERLKDQLIKISNELASDNIALVAIPRLNIVFGKPIKHCGWWPDYMYRFFRSGRVEWQHAIHSLPKAQGSIHYLPLDDKQAIIHHSYNSISQFIDKMNHYTSIEAMGTYANGRRTSPLRIVAKTIKHFVQRYVVDRGFLDGQVGFIICGLLAIYNFNVESKIWELQRNDNSKQN